MKTRAVAVFAAGALAGATVVGTVAYAAIPNPTTHLYYACVKNAGGAVRIIDYPKARCARGESMKSWNATGVRGPAGLPGAKGATGAAGAGLKVVADEAGRGAAGVGAPSGTLVYVQATGHLWEWANASWTDKGSLAGSKGDTGVQGAQGATGQTGPAGPDGPQGVPGPAGSQGLAGPTGAKGATGADGVVGPTGASGASVRLYADEHAYGTATSNSGSAWTYLGSKVLPAGSYSVSASFQVLGTAPVNGSPFGGSSYCSLSVPEVGTVAGSGLSNAWPSPLASGSYYATVPLVGYVILIAPTTMRYVCTLYTPNGIAVYLSAFYTPIGGVQ